MRRAARHPARRVLSSESAYRGALPQSRSAHNRALDVVDAYERDPSRSLSFYTKSHGTTLPTFKKHVPTRSGKGRRLDLAPPGVRRLFRGPIAMLADVDGVPTVVRVVPSNDAQRRAIEGHDSAVFAAVTEDDDSRLGKYRSRIVVDGETGERFRFAVDGDTIRDATDVGSVELEDLFYSGRGRHDLDALLFGGSS